MRPTRFLILLLAAVLVAGCDMNFAPDLRGLECITPGITEVGSAYCDSVARGAPPVEGLPAASYPDQLR